MFQLGDPSKPALVFIHGFLGAPDDWLEVVKEITEHYYCLLLTVPDRDSADSPLRHWNDLIDACAKQWSAVLPARFSLIGYSLGGRIALALSQIWTDRLDALVLEGAHPGLANAQERSQRRQEDSVWADSFRIKTRSEALQRWYRQPVFATLSDVQRADLVSVRGQAGGARIADLLLAASLAGQPDYWTQLLALPVPLLYISGARDTKFCHLAHQLADLRPSLVWQQLPDTGHNCHHESPKPYAAVLAQFLTQVHHD